MDFNSGSDCTNRGIVCISDLGAACVDPNVCGPGICMPEVDGSYTCDCSMTGYAGIPCSDSKYHINPLIHNNAF